MLDIIPKTCPNCGAGHFRTDDAHDLGPHCRQRGRPSRRLAPLPLTNAKDGYESWLFYPHRKQDAGVLA